MFLANQNAEIIVSKLSIKKMKNETAFVKGLRSAA